MVHGTVKALFRVLGGLLLGLVIVVLLLMWRLGQGPIVLDQLTPSIEQAINGGRAPLRTKLGHTVLKAGQGIHMLEIHAIDVRVFPLTGDRPVLVVPDMAFDLGVRALLAGILAPSAIRLDAPRLRLARGLDGRIDWGIGAAGSDPSPDSAMALDSLRDTLLGDPDPAKPGRELQSFTVRDAVIEVEDQRLGLAWRFPKVNLAFQRVKAGLSASGSLNLDQGGAPMTLDLSGLYRKDNGILDLTARVGQLRPAALAHLAPPLAPLEAFDLLVAGTVHLRTGPQGGIESLEADLSGGDGILVPPADLGGGKIHLRKASLKAAATLPGRAELTSLKLDFGGGTMLTASGGIDGVGGGGPLRAEVTLTDLPVDRLGQLWPQRLGQNVRDWVIPNLSGGRIHEATLTLGGRLGAGGTIGDLSIDQAGGTIRAEGVTVDYLHPMPPASNVSATVTYSANTMRVTLGGGEVFGLRLKDGTVVFTGLDQANQFADIGLTIAGPVPDALRLIDSPPLRYAQALGIEPGRAGGEGSTRLGLKFPLLKALRLDDIEIRAQSTLKGLSLPKVALGQDLDGGALDLAVDTRGLDASGQVRVGGIPAHLTWRENFSSRGTAFRSRYHLRVPDLGEAERRRLGLDGAPFVAPFLSGPVGADIGITLADSGRGEITAAIDLAAAAMRLPGLGWSKAEGTPGQAEVTVRLDHNQIAAIPRFMVRSHRLDVEGAVSFTPEGEARRIDFSRLVAGRTIGSGSLIRRPGHDGLDITFTGTDFDAAPALDDKGDAKSARAADAPETDKPPAMTVTVRTNRLWVSETGSLTQATISLERDASDWRALSVRGSLDGSRTLTAALAPDGASHRRFTVASDDAGAVARAFEIYDNMIGGDLTIEGRIDDSRPNQPRSGIVKVTDYQVRDTPALARLLTVASLTGIVDVLRGDGVSFSALEAPFTLSDGQLVLKDARTWGPALGITAKGLIDLTRARLAIEGTVVPAYTLNSILGQVPVLGWLVTGGEKGGGVIAFNYTMKGASEDPVVTVNPLSALTPGFLRKLFNIFDAGPDKEDGGATDAPSPADPGSAPAPAR